MVESTEIQAAFKETEVGMIPSDWEVRVLDEIGQFKKGKNIPRNELKTDGVACVLYGEIYTKYGTHASQLISRTSLETSKNSTLIKTGDVLFAGSGETAEDIGKCFTYVGSEQAFAGGDVIILTPKGTNSLFLGFILNSKPATTQKANMGQGSSVYHIYPSNLKKLAIPLPPTLAEQTAIATALNDADALITQLEKLIAKKRAIKQGTMQELLKPKEGWEVKRLGECLRENPSYGINAAAVPFNDSLPVYLRITDITDDGRYSKESVVSVSDIDSSFYYLEEGDIVFARTGASVGKTYLYDKKDGELVFAGFLIRVKTNPKTLNPIYFKYYTQTSEYWTWINANSMRTGQPGINGHEYKSLTFSIPSIEAQAQIAQTLSDMDAEIEALEKKLTKYQLVKQGMMQNLLTGKIRLV